MGAAVVDVVQPNGAAQVVAPVSAARISALAATLIGLSGKVGALAAIIRDPDWLRSYAAALDDERELATPELIATLRATADASGLSDEDRASAEQARASWNAWAEGHIQLLQSLLDEAAELQQGAVAGAH